MQKYLNNYKLLYGIIIVLLVLGILETSYLFANHNNEKQFENTMANIIDEEKVNVIPNEIIVDLKGEVKKPGIYKLPEGSIINDIILKAGGFTKNAYKDNINLSKVLDNEQVIFIYSKTQYKNLNQINNYDKCSTKTIYIDSCLNEGASIITNTNDPVKSDNNEEDSIPKIININTATIAELMTLNGIGESKAEDIIFYREKNGPFKTIEEIKNVSGIGDKTFENLKDFITV